MKTILLTGVILILCCPRSMGQQAFAPGEITQEVTCRSDSSQRYALYLPSGYSDQQAFPVIFFFEPAARAMLPLEKYRHLADRYGYVLACSYNSRNGPNEPIFEAANAMYADAFERLSLEKERVCLAGFSGGARISCLIAMSNPGIHAVIGCGAGFPYSKMPEEPVTFDYCGIIGRQDMNYQEMILLDSVLDRQAGNHVLFTFPEDHRWPDSNTFKSAFYWLDTRAMRNGQVPRSDNLIKRIENEFVMKIDSLDRRKEVLALARAYKNLLILLEGISDISSYRAGYEELLGSERYRQALLIHYQDLAIESGMHQKYWSEFEEISLRALDPDHPVKSSSWWKKEFRKIDDLADPDLSARLREFVVNGSWEQHISSLRKDRYVVALAYLDVYEAGLPDDPSPDYYRARVYALAEDPVEMYRFLEKALEKGLNSQGYITGDEAFQPYLQQKNMTALLDQMKTNQTD